MHLQWSDWPYHLIQQHRTPKAKARDNFWVSTLASTCLPFEWSAPIPVCVYTYSSSNLTEVFYSQPRDTLLERRRPMENDLSLNGGLIAPGTSVRANFPYTENPPQFDALLLPWTSARAKCTYGEDTLTLKDSEDEKLSLDWSELTVAIHGTAWSAFTVTDRHISSHRL